MPNINSVNVKITGDESGLKRATKEAQSDIGKIGNSALSIGKIAIGSALGSALTNVVGKAISAITSEMDGAIARLDTINNYGKVMGNLGIGADDSAKSIDYLQEHLLGLPTSLDDAALAVQRFTAANGNIKASTVGYLALNNALLAGGASMQTQATAMEQLAQAYSKGKPDAMEWRALLTAMPAQLNQIAQAAGYTSAVIGGDFYNAIQDGKFSMNDFLATAIRLNSEGVNGFASFDEQARNATVGVQTSIANLKNAMQRGLAEVMNAIGQANIAGFINGVAAAIGTVANYVAAFVRLIKEAVAWLGVLFGFKVGGGKSTADATKATATNLQAGEKAAGGVASGLNNAAGAAKKLNNQLASFDEMNVLRETTSGGSGGGGGGGGVGAGSFALPEIDWNLDDSKKKENEIERILEKLRKAFDKFAKFLKPIARVVADIWKSYLAPFFTWVGNDLLPAFFNAVGGALELLGSIIESVYNVALKPLIDNFLVPIAKFTGGVIVTVLNAIGDALSWVAQQKDAINFMVNFAEAVAIVIAAIVGWNAAATAIGIILTRLTGDLVLLPTILGKTAVGFAGVQAGTAAASTAIAGATAATKILNAVFSSTTIIIGAVIAAVTAVNVAMEAWKLAVMEAEARKKSYITAAEKTVEAIDWENDAVQAQINLKKTLKDLDAEVTNNKLGLLNAQKAVTSATENAEAIAAKYGKTLEVARDEVNKMDIASGNLTVEQQELADAIFNLEQAEDNERVAKNKLSESIDTQKQKTTELTDQQWKQVAAEKEQEIMALLMENKYEDVAGALDDLSSHEEEYTLKNGETVRLTKQDYEDMANFIGDQMAQVNTSSGKAWNGVWQAADYNVNKVKAKTKELAASGYDGGVNFAAGIEQGINAKSYSLLNLTGSIGSRISAQFRKALDIHSPSRVMAEAGEFIVMGIEEGMMDQEGSLLRTTESLGEALTSAFDANVQLPQMVGADAADKLDAIAGRAQANLTMNSENTAGAIESLANAIIAMQEDKQPIIVKVGEETLVDTMIEGINNASTMRNRGVINI